MTREEIQNYLIKIQEQDPHTKLSNAILSCFDQTKKLEKLVIELRQKINEIIEFINMENAEPVNEEEDLINDYTGAASQE